MRYLWSKKKCGLLGCVLLTSIPFVCNAQPSGNARFGVLGSHGLSKDGRRKLADFELDAYGPLPFPEAVFHFIDNEITLLLDRQRENGSFEMIDVN